MNNYRNSIILGACAAYATFTCGHHEILDPNFSIELFHLQDASPANDRGRSKMKDIYRSFMRDMQRAEIPVKMGTAGFVDDDGFKATENGRFCFKKVTDLSPVQSYVEALERLNQVPADQSNYDRYEAGFKALTMAAKKGGLVNWSDNNSTLKMLVTASNAAPKVKEGRRKCVANTYDMIWNDCLRWNDEASFQSADECMDVTNQPTYDDFNDLADRAIHYINFVYYNDSEIESYFGARARWGSVTYELTKRGFKASLIDESRYYYLYSSMLKLVAEKACVDKHRTTTSTTTTGPAGCARPTECYCSDDKATGYKGDVSVSTSGDTCINWADGPNHNDTEGNFCRNPTPNLADRPWCYVSDTGSWGWCPVPKCGCNNYKPDECGCKDNWQSDYRGKINTTVGGKKCQKWSAQTPHAHNYNPNEGKYKDTGLEENYCRNPLSEEDRPWCWVDDASPSWDWCDVPLCE